MQLTPMASARDRILARRPGNGLRTANARTHLRKAVRASATIKITPDRIVVHLGRRALNPLLRQVRYPEIRETIPWPSPGWRTAPSGYGSTTRATCMPFPGAGNPG